MAAEGGVDHGGPPAEGLVERVRAVVPTIAATSFEAEAQRRPLDEVIEALKATGVFRSFVPARYGGYEIDLATYLDIGVAVAEADPSMGWITTFYMEHNWLLTMFADELQDEVFGGQPFVLAPGSVNPTGRAIDNGDGTYSLSGHWTFGTGICHADWVLLSGKIGDDDVARNFLARVGDVEVKDTWHVDGMAATGSRDIHADHVLVPERRVSLFPPPHLTARPGDPYLHRIPVAPFLSLTAAMPAVGAAKRALVLFESRLFDRVMFGTKRTQSHRVPTQVRLANLRVEVDAIELLMSGIVARMQDHVDGTIDLDLLAQLELRLAIAHVVRRCREVVREIMQSSGASVHYLDNELQRLHRDIHMICAHTVFDVDLVAEGVGKAIVAERTTPAAGGEG
ncbi:MAG TPA: acyl-CoA dehydrogenase family protein [Acidimicrobiales bacterium]|jgi:alkylation response protein AidB-like acyl-CoA dehydrogenase|nr:acyl-CoA dehydrogenase family protein [Acidimicrobiales bacterium]